MYLYSLTLHRPTGIVAAINGNFSGGKAEDIVLARSKVLDLLRPDSSGKVQTLLSVEIFSYIVIGSDSGRIVILDYNKEKNSFDKVHQKTFAWKVVIGKVPIYDSAASSESPYLLAGFHGKLHVLTKDAHHHVLVLRADLRGPAAESLSGSPAESLSDSDSDAESLSDSDAVVWKAVARRDFGSAELVSCQVLDI